MNKDILRYPVFSIIIGPGNINISGDFLKKIEKRAGGAAQEVKNILNTAKIYCQIFVSKIKRSRKVYDALYRFSVKYFLIKDDGSSLKIDETTKYFDASEKDLKSKVLGDVRICASILNNYKKIHILELDGTVSANDKNLQKEIKKWQNSCLI